MNEWLGIQIWLTERMDVWLGKQMVKWVNGWVGRWVRRWTVSGFVDEWIDV